MFILFLKKINTFVQAQFYFIYENPFHAKFCGVGKTNSKTTLSMQNCHYRSNLIIILQKHLYT